MIVFRLEPINALRRDFVIAGGVFLDPCLKAKGAVSHHSHGDKPSGFKFIHGASEGIAADEYFRFGQVDVSHKSLVLTESFRNGGTYNILHSRPFIRRVKHSEASRQQVGSSGN